MSARMTQFCRELSASRASALAASCARTASSSSGASHRVRCPWRKSAYRSFPLPAKRYQATPCTNPLTNDPETRSPFSYSKCPLPWQPPCVPQDSVQLRATGVQRLVFLGVVALARGSRVAVAAPVLLSVEYGSQLEREEHALADARELAVHPLACPELPVRRAELAAPVESASHDFPDVRGRAASAMPEARLPRELVLVGPLEPLRSSLERAVVHLRAASLAQLVHARELPASVHAVILPGADVLVAVPKHAAAVAVAFRLLELSFVRAAVPVHERAVAAHVSVVEVAFVRLAVRERHGAVAALLPAHEAADELERCALDDADAVRLVVFPLAFVPLALVGAVDPHPLAPALAVDKVSDVRPELAAAAEQELAKAVVHSLSELAGVPGAAPQPQLATPLPLAMHPLAVVDVAVRVRARALAVVTPVDPLAVIDVAAPSLGGAFAVPAADDEVALVALARKPLLREWVLALADREEAEAVEEVLCEVAHVRAAAATRREPEQAFAMALAVEPLAVVDIAVRVLEASTAKDGAVVS
ncbi:hypothetical protein PybrP1_008682 [[Pythium] brassicae (nom. inval.)]|nr:hypothetical protein PybrP1_008682 [[Pythium] brassicae (nom. inval.)]